MRSIIFILAISILSSCEDRVNLNFDRVDKRLVVEGTITDRNEPYYIRLSYPSKYTYTPSISANLEVTNATVTVEDDLANTYSFDEDSPGLYVSEPSEFQGAVGRSYTLHITTNEGKVYRSTPELLNAIAPLDSLYYDVEGSEYFLFIDLQDPPETGNYYQWKIHYGGQSGDWIDVAPDDYFNGNYLKRFLKDSGEYEDVIGSVVTVEQLSITKEKYKFLNLMDQQINNGGTPFDAPASPIVGNVFNEQNSSDYALGYFGASAILSKTIIID